MKTTQIFGLLLAFAYTAPTSALMTYQEANDNLLNAPAAIKNTLNNAPVDYQFISRFDQQNNTSHTGQTFRQILVHDLKKLMNGLERGTYPGTAAQALTTLNSFYDYQNDNPARSQGSINQNQRFKVSAKDLDGMKMPIFEGFTYGEIQSPGKNLKSKLAGNDNPLRRSTLMGWKTTLIGETTLHKTNGVLLPEALLMAFFTESARLAAVGDEFTMANGDQPAQTITKATVLENGIDLTQLTQKFLHGALSFSQAARDYLSNDLGDSKGLNANNTESYKGKNYTQLEHHWDEAFGYFGAAKNYMAYDLALFPKKVSIDTDEDGELSLLNEFNHALSINAGKLDYTFAKNGLLKNKVTEAIFSSLVKGRYLIGLNKPEHKVYIESLAAVALGNWEKTFAGMVIHYINKTIKEMNEYGTAEYLFLDHSKYWSEMKGFALSFQFHPQSRLADQDFDKLHALLGDAPSLPQNGMKEAKDYQVKLLQAREILQKSFEFSQKQVDIL